MPTKDQQVEESSIPKVSWVKFWVQIVLSEKDQGSGRGLFIRIEEKGFREGRTQENTAGITKETEFDRDLEEHSMC